MRLVATLMSISMLLQTSAMAAPQPPQEMPWKAQHSMLGGVWLGGFSRKCIGVRIAEANMQDLKIRQLVMR